MNSILVGKAVTTPDSGNVQLLAKYGNRHGLVAGATGTGKTVTLMTLAEGFSKLGVPVFMADVKGDVAGLALAGTPNDKITQRIAEIGIEGYVRLAYCVPEEMIRRSLPAFAALARDYRLGI